MGEYILREFWQQIFEDALFRHVNVQSKTVFSYALTLMDKMRGWEDEEKRVGSKFATCMWIYTKKALTKEQIPNPAMKEYLKKQKLPIMLCTNWVCAGTFIDHEWVSESTISEYEEENLGMQVDYGLDVPCVVQWSLLWLSEPTRLNQILGLELKIKMYHEVVNISIMDASVRPFGGNTHRGRAC